MKKQSKRYKEAVKLVDPKKVYEVEEAISVLKKTPKVKFDESIEVSVKLAKKPVQPEQQIRTTISLPKGTGKKVRVLVFVKGEKEKDAREAGADFVGGDDMIEKVKGGFLDFDIAIAAPDMMKDVGKLGKILGTKGLMPNPKSGTVAPDVAKAVKEFKAGKVEFRSSKDGIVNLSIGKMSFTESDITENALYFIRTFLKLPALATKGQYIKSMYISSTMGPGLQLNFKKYM